jgi:hypothetical protein
MSRAASAGIKAMVLGIDPKLGLGAIVAEACGRAGIEACFEGMRESEGSPHLIIGMLPPGARVIPDEIIRLGDRHPQCAIALLSADRLVRPTVTLQRGRVLLLSPPHDVGSIARRIRQAIWKLRQPAHLDTARGLQENAGLLRSQVRVSNRYWAGMLSTHGSDASVLRSKTNASAEDNLILAVTDTQGFVEPLAAIPHLRQLRGARELAEVAPSLPEGTMMIGLFNASQWCVMKNKSAARVWVVSPLRFPNTFSISDRLTRTDESSTVMAAQTGDVLITTASSAALDAQSLAVALSSGGLGFHELLQTSLTAETSTLAAAIVEVI